MGRPFDIEYPFGGKYLPRLAGKPLPGPVPVIVSGRNIWPYEEFCETWMGMGSSIANMSIGLMVPLGSDSVPGGIGAGTVLLYRADSTWFIGSGLVYRNGSSIATASSALQFILSSVLFTAGLAAPAAPVLRLTNETGRKPRGTFSVKITQVRTLTGEESNASPVSVSVTATGQRLLIDMNGIATAGDGKRWAVYGTNAGSSLLGPWYFRLEFDSSQLSTVTDSGSVGRPNSIAVEWYDFESSSILAPFDFAVPPPGTHLTTLGAVMCVLGSYGGAGVSPSLPGRLGWPATYTRFLNPAEPIIRVDGRPGNGWQAVFTKQSLQGIILSGDSLGPVFVRSWWPTVGIHNESGAAMIETDIFAVSGDGYLVRSNGTEVPDTSFAYEVRPDVKNINPATAVVGYHPKEDAVIFMDGAVAFPYLRGKQSWAPPFDLPAVAESAATVAGKLYVKFAGGTVQAFDGGAGGQLGRALGPWLTMGNARHRKAIYGWESVVKGGGTTSVYGNKNASSALESVADTTSGEGHVPQNKTDVKNLKTFAMERSNIASGDRAYQVGVHGVVDETYVDL